MLAVNLSGAGTHFSTMWCRSPTWFFRQPHPPPRRCCNRRALSPSFSEPSPIRSAAALLRACRGRAYDRLWRHKTELTCVSHRTEAKTDPRTELIGLPIEWPLAWTAFRWAASRQNRPPAQHQRQRQLSQSQRDIWLRLPRLRLRLLRIWALTAHLSRAGGQSGKT
jgi:hypothetical protein